MTASSGSTKFTIETDAGLQKKLAAIGIFLYVVLSLIWAFSTHATWDDDCPTRAFNALHAFQDPIQFVSPWNRPLFMLVFAFPVQLGFWTIPVLMTAFTAWGAWHLFRALETQQVPWRSMVVIFYLFQTYSFVISHNALTEPMAMTLIAVGFSALVHRWWTFFAVAGGLLVLARLELVLLLPIWAYILVKNGQMGRSVWLALPFVVWNLAGGVLTGDWTYVFSATLGEAGEISRYGSTPVEHYFLRYIYVTGPVVLFFGILGLLWRAVQKRSEGFLDVQFVAGFILYVGISAWVAAGNSAGFLRNLIPVTPLLAVLAVDGLNLFMRTAMGNSASDWVGNQGKFWVWGWLAALLLLSALMFNVPLKMHMLPDPSRTFWANAVWVAGLGMVWVLVAVLKRYQLWMHRIGHASMGIISLGTVSFTLLAEPPGANDSVERQIVTEMAIRVNELAGDSKAVHVNHIWYFWTQGKDPEDKRFQPITQGSLAQTPVGSVLLWDLHYSPRLGGDVGLEYFESHREWTEVLSYRNAGENFLGKVFVKSPGERESSYSISESYLQNHADLPAAWSAAGNVRLRWADFASAVPFFERASQIDAYDPDVWFGLGLGHLKLRNMPLAEKALLQARDLDAQSSSVWFHLASVHAAMDQGQRAISELTTCIQIQPDFVNAYFARGACQGRLGRLDAAVSDFSQALSLQPNHVEARFNRGATYAMMKQHDLAIADLEMALKSMPSNSDGWMFLGKSQLALGNLQAACAAFNKAKQLGSINADEPLGQYCQEN